MFDKIKFGVEYCVRSPNSDDDLYVVVDDGKYYKILARKSSNLFEYSVIAIFQHNVDQGILDQCKKNMVRFLSDSCGVELC